MNLKPPREYRDPANIIENKQEHASRKLGTFYDLPEGVNQLQKTFYPSCFDSVDQWLEYRKSARAAQQVCTICEDCTHQYQAEMIKQGRCDRVRGIEWMAYTSKARKQEDA